MKEKTPIQYSTGYSSLLKWFLHTKVGAKVGYVLGITGFNRIGATITRTNGKVEKLGFAYNARVAKGGDLIASLITGASQNSITSPLPPKYIALSTSTLTPANGDTTLSGETSSSGMGRALGTIGSYVTPSTLDGSASYIISKTFTASGTITIVSAALFDAVSTGNMFVEANLSSSATLNNGDVLTVNWTINL